MLVAPTSPGKAGRLTAAAFVVSRRKLSWEGWVFTSCFVLGAVFVVGRRKLSWESWALVAAACWVVCLLSVGQNCPGKVGRLVACCVLGRVFVVGRRKLSWESWALGSCCCVLGRVFVVGRRRLSWESWTFGGIDWNSAIFRYRRKFCNVFFAVPFRGRSILGLG